MTAARICLPSAILLALISQGAAWGHAFNPSLLELRELPGGRIGVLWKGAGAVGAEGLKPKLPARCHQLGDRVSTAVGTTLIERWVIDCGRDGLAGAEVGMSGYELIGEDAVVRITRADGQTISAVLRSDAPSWVIPAPNSSKSILASYLGAGVKHILLGYDHLLFVLGLILLVGLGRRLLVTITAFTVAHSATLSLATLHVVRFPSRATEAVIALSIVFLAVELARDQSSPKTWAMRRPWLVAFTFGLLHGFGFAGALAEIGLPPGEIPLALFSFNVGVEIGQLLFVGAIAAIIALLRLVRSSWPSGLRRAIAYAVGSLAAWWCFERVAAFWA
jgi:hydrogenase/urease accessory protein HupE